MDSEYSWTQDNIFHLIEARSKFKVDFNNTPDFVYQHIINELGLTNKVSIKSASRLWESLITKYKELSQPALEPEDAAPPSWQYYEAVHNALLSLPPTIMEMEASPIDINTSSKMEIPLNTHENIVVELGKKNEQNLMKGNVNTSHKHPNEESYKGLQNELMDGPQEDSQEEYEDSHDVSQITLDEDPNEDTREETFEEEAARLEEAFCNGNIVAIDSVVNDEEEEEEKVVIDEFLDVDEDCIDEDVVEQIEEIQEEEEEEEKGSNYIVDHIWTREKVLELINLRGEREADVISIGHRPVFMQMLEELGLATRITPSEATKKWSSLVRKYFQIKTKLQKEAGLSDDFQNCDVEKTSIEVSSWPFYEAMEKVMEKIIKTSPDGGMKLRRSPEYHWGTDITKKFIRLRLEKQPEISLKGHNAVYQDILEKLQIVGKVSVMMARKKWNYLVKRYQDEELAGGERTWVFMNDMRQVMKYFRSCSPTKLRTRASPEFLWPNDLTKEFIKLRVARYEDFIEGLYQNTYTEIMEQLGLEHILTPNHLRKKWNYLVSKYRELSCSTGPDGTHPAPHGWPFFEDMRKAMKSIPNHLLNSSKIIRVNYENIWTKDVLLKFIELKGKKSAKSPKKLCLVFTEIIEELGLENQITAHQARKKWNYLYNKYLDLSHPEVDEFVRKSWPYYTAMQDAVGSLPLSQTLNKKSIGDELEGDEDDSGLKQYQRKPRSYTCFLCGKIGRFLNDFFMFENNQCLLHTQKNVLDIIAHLIGKKVMSFSSTTCLCSDCTNLVNEADNIIFRHDKVKMEAKKLYNSSNHSRTSNDKGDKDVSNQQNSSLSKDNLESQEMDDFSEEIEKEDENQSNGKEEIKISEQKVSYSKRGRKRKHIVRNDGVYTGIKSEPVDDVYESTEGEIDHDDEEYVDERKKMKLKGRGRGRGKKKKRGRPTKIARTTLVGKGLGGLYPSSNKRKPLNFKGPKIYHCSECKGEFKKYMDLINHKREVHTVIDTSTLEVEETVLDNGVITYFNKGKANNSDTCHTCRDCNKQFLRKDDLWYHQEIAHTEGKGRTKTAFKDRSYDCEECGEKFLFKYKLKMHINSKHLNDAGKNANDFTCGECGCKLGSLPGLTFHMRKHHNKSLTYRKTTEYLCSDCGFLAASNKKLKEHHESHCGSTSKPKVQCEICGKTVLKVSLKMHKIKMHSDFKEQCDRCGERYATKTDLLRHINVVHLRILLYSCRYCNERFPTSDALRYHRVKVHEKPSFFCQNCGKCYKRVGELNTHIKRAHNDRKKGEVCHYCFKEYYDRSGLRTHLVNKHDVPQEMTYSENYMRKKRVDGLPLAKHMEKKGMMDSKMMADGRMMSTVIQSPILHHQLQPGHPQHQQHQHQQQHQQQQQAHLASQQLAILHHHPHVQQQQLPAAHMGPAAEHATDEAAEAARNLSNTYHEMSNAEEEGSLVVTEITESPQVEQTVLVDPLSGTQAFLPHPAHMQPMAAHHHIHQQVNYQANMRLNFLCQMNIQNPGPSHLNM